MNYPDDGPRQLQVLQSETFHNDHIFNRFMWGNKLSLNNENGTRMDELRGFFDKYYSADRLALCIQVKTSDNCKTLRKWVEDSFSVIENKKLGI